MSTAAETKPRLVSAQFVMLGCAALAYFFADGVLVPSVPLYVTGPLTGGDVAGYVYAGLEPMSWKELRGEAGFVHDVAVDPSARRLGIAAALLEAAMEWLKEQGAPRVVLWTAEQNVDAQRLFARVGFRRTMIEMTREL